FWLLHELLQLTKFLVLPHQQFDNLIYRLWSNHQIYNSKKISNTSMVSCIIDTFFISSFLCHQLCASTESFQSYHLYISNLHRQQKRSRHSWKSMNACFFNIVKRLKLMTLT